MKRIIWMVVCLSLFLSQWALDARAVNSPPQGGTANVSKSTAKAGEEVYLNTTFIDPDGWQHLLYGISRLRSTIDKTKNLYLYYKQSSNRLYMYDPDAAKYMGGYKPGSNYTIENRFALLDCSKTVITGHDDTLAVTWAVTFKDDFAGESYRMYLWTGDDEGVRSPWKYSGVWRVLKRIPRIMRFQGRLEDKDETPLGGAFTLTFRLYDAQTGGLAAWEERQADIAIEKGLLDVELGSVTPLDISFDKQYWLGVEVESDGEMMPRFKLTSVPYAVRSEE